LLNHVVDPQIRRIYGANGNNDLLERIGADPAFSAVAERLAELCDPARFVGRAPEQVDEFLAERVEPVLAARREVAAAAGEVRV